jgi:hypothetical protein
MKHILTSSFIFFPLLAFSFLVPLSLSTMPLNYSLFILPNIGFFRFATGYSIQDKFQTEDYTKSTQEQKTNKSADCFINFLIFLSVPKLRIFRLLEQILRSFVLYSMKERIFRQTQVYV